MNLPRCWRAWRRIAGVIVTLALVWLKAGAAVSDDAPLPYRFLLVIHDQWKDPASEVIEGPNEFSLLAALLRSWGLPYDIYRLDQQRFDAYHLLDREGRPRYGTMVWDAPNAPLSAEAITLLETMVKQHGVGLVALGDAAVNPAIEALAGLRMGERYRSGEPARVVREHFITRDWNPHDHADTSPKDLRRGGWTDVVAPPDGIAVVPSTEADVLVSRAGHPQLTQRAYPGGGRVVWLDFDRRHGQLMQPSIRDLLKRSLIWTQGYALVAEYPRSVILFMDDMGTSDKTYYPEWHYPTPSEPLIRDALIQPLQRHRAVMVQNVNTGFLDRRTRRVLDPWRQNHVPDELEPTRFHDYASTKLGLDAGIQAGVFEIQSHGWTHMAPDLDSPPGPFWSAPPRSAIVQLNWYKEFGDAAREQEIPAIVQRLHLQRSLDDLAQDFHVRPVSLRCGGTHGSDSAPNNTMRMAAKMGFGIGQAEAICSLSPEFCVPLNPISPIFAWNYMARLEGTDVPWTNDAPVWLGSHDRDIAMDPGSYARLLDDLGDGVRYMTCAEYCAYLHAVVSRERESTGLALQVSYDAQYCAYFEGHPSKWVLYLADETRSADQAERQEILLPPGLGPHRIAVPFVRSAR